MDKPNIILVANSPGELAALVKPVAEELQREKSARVILVLTPCQYTSGREIEFSRTLKGIDQIISASEYQKWMMLNRQPRDFDFSAKGVVLFLGGDLMHARLIAKNLKYPAFAYLNERVAWKNFYRKFFVADAAAFHKFSKAIDQKKIEIVGNLMVDAVSDLKKWAPEPKIITFMPGSRKWEIDYMTPFYKKIIEIINFQQPGIHFQLVSSPFIKARPLENTRIVDFAEISNSELVITIPGTNTAKLAARGIPTLMVFPLNNPELIPFEGLGEIIGKIPVMGKAFKRTVARLINRRTRFFALPNQKAGQEIVPELRGQLDPATVAQNILSLYQDKKRLASMSSQLLKALGPSGAARKIAGEIYAAL
jgi:lipid-A-disaccharide synthase